MLRSTPRIEVNQRSREARLRLERVERLIAVVMTRRSLLVPRTGGLAAKLRRVLSRSGLVLTALTDLAQWPQMTWRAGRADHPRPYPRVRSRLYGLLNADLS
jgi:hypothetical protein